MTTAEIIAFRKDARNQRIIDALDEAERTIAYRLDVALDTLVFERCFPPGFDGSKARTELCDRAARAAIAALLADAGVPGEARWLFVERHEEAGQ